MSNKDLLLSDCDEDDEDYVPDDEENESLSEVGSDNEVESNLEVENNENKKDKRKNCKSKKRIKGITIKRKRKITSRFKEQENMEETEDTKELDVKNTLTEEEEKKHADSLWADFMKDTAVVSRSKTQNSTNDTSDKYPSMAKSKIEKKVKITKIFEFAGEEVRVEKEVPIDSAEARLSLTSAENSTKTSESACTGKEVGKGKGLKRSGLGGISSVLSQIGKKAKISTLEKSKLDWDNYKKQENLEEELSTHNKGKDGYLERQDFLQRADLRQFEIEKQLRNASRHNTR